MKDNDINNILITRELYIQGSVNPTNIDALYGYKGP